MRHTKGSVGWVFVGLMVVAVFGCAKQKAAEAPPPEASAPAAPAEFKVAGLEVGKQIGADKKVMAPMTTFAPKDTIYVSVATDGAAPSATLEAKWTYGDKGQLVNQQSETIAPTGPAATEFHIAKPSGWPAGKYKVEITANGSPAGSKEFEVRK